LDLINQMAKGKKYYVVWVGNNPGIYESWADTQLQVKSFPNAKYKSFKTKEEAEEAFGGPYEFKAAKSKSKPEFNREDVLPNTLSVDAACSGNPGIMEYRGVDTDSGDELFRQGPFKHGTNNIGEFLAIIHGLAYLKQIGDTKKIIYTDSRTALAWLRKKKANTKVNLAQKNPTLLKLLRRGELWLQNNTYENKVIKWETKMWGEIPADFGRK
jgi:ribonuclease HI